jgi:phage terminase Nu1 subunit (DNA packaging protein)
MSDDNEFENLDSVDEGDGSDDITSGAEVQLVRGDRVNKAELCRMLGKSDATISKYIKEGMPILRRGSRREGYEFDTAAVVAWLTKYAVELATGDPDTMSLEKAKRRNIAAQARSRELEYAKASGETVFRKELAAIADSKFGELRSRLVTIPSALAGSITTEQEAILIGAINDALSDLSSPAFWIPPEGLIIPDGDDEEAAELEDDSEGDN